jgi:hypothetical protein
MKTFDYPHLPLSKADQQKIYWDANAREKMSKLLGLNETGASETNQVEMVSVPIDAVFIGDQRILWHVLDYRPRPTWIFAEIMEKPSKNITKQLQQMADRTGLVKFERNGKLKNWYK